MSAKWTILILFLAGLLAYGNTAKNGLFWDDDEFITRNGYIRSFRYLPQWFSQPLTAGAGVNSNYYRPLLQLSFAIDYKLWKLWPAGYHIENMLWHMAAGILVFLFLQRFLAINGSRLTVNGSRAVAFATALLWLVHPVHVEAVAYANSRGDSMATVFVLLTLILWTKKRFWASAAAFVLALLSKEFAIVTPGLIILLEFMKHQIPNAKSQTILKSQSQNSKQARQSGSLRNFQSYIDDKRSLLIYITNLASKKLYRLSTIVVNLYNFIKPIFLHITIAVIYLILRLTVLNFQNTLNFYGSSPQRSNLCTQQRLDLCNPLELYATSLPTRLMTFLKVLPIYGRILVWPNDLHMERTVEIATTAADKTAMVAAAVVIVILLSCYLATLKNNFVPVFAAGWFFIFILPVSGLIPISQILAEHFLYLPSIGFFLIFGWFLISLLSWVERTLLIYRHPERSDLPASCFAARRWQAGESRRDCHVHDLKSGLAMTQTPLPGRLNDSNHLTLIYLSYWVILLGISIPLIIKTVRQNRIWRYPITFYEYTLAHAEPTARMYNNLAMAYADRGEHQKAINNYQLAINLGDVYPNPHYNLGNTLMEVGKLDEAEREYRRALEVDPSFHYATLKLGQIYIDKGKIEDAKKLVCPVFPTQPLCQH